MKTVTINREDFGGRADSAGMPYFDYILEALGVSDTEKPDVETIELIVSDYTIS